MPNIGFKHSEETKKKMSIARIGKPHPMVEHVYNPRSKGSKHTEEAKKKMSQDRKGEKHHNWKGGISENKKIYNRLWRKNNTGVIKEYNRLAKLKANYGITTKQYEEIVNKQNGKCAICDCEPKTRYLHVDHCHKTNKIRGLLCHNCNTGIGLLKESKDIFIKAIKYLEEL